MATLSGRLQVQAMVRPQELWIFQEVSKAKLVISPMVFKDLRLQLWSDLQTRVYYEKDKYSIQIVRVANGELYLFSIYFQFSFCFFFSFYFEN